MIACWICCICLLVSMVHLWFGPVIAAYCICSSLRRSVSFGCGSVYILLFGVFSSTLVITVFVQYSISLSIVSFIILLPSLRFTSSDLLFINSPRYLSIIDTLKSLKPDQTEFNIHIPSWDSTLPTYKFTELPMAKHNCSLQLLRRVANRAFQESQEPGCTVYYTDGTVNPDTNTSGAAVYSEQCTACWRVSDGASTMQTELVAITQALLYSSTYGIGPVTIHTDSKSALQAL